MGNPTQKLYHYSKNTNKKMTVIEIDITFRIEVLGKSTGNQLTGVKCCNASLKVVTRQEMSEVSVWDDPIKAPLISF